MALTKINNESGLIIPAGISSSSTSGTALSIDANNIVTTPSKPMMSVRGRNGTVANSSVFSAFIEITSWSATDVNVGNCLQNGRFRAPVAGVYHLSAWSQSGTSTDYRHCRMAYYNGSAYTTLFETYAFNDYQDYTVGCSLLYPLTAGDEILVGWDNNYANWSTAITENSFTGYLVS
jgi:hypothetical protein